MLRVVVACIAALCLALPPAFAASPKIESAVQVFKAVSGTLTGLADGATYRLQCPPGAWNGTLYLYSHGYVAPGSAKAVPDEQQLVSNDRVFAYFNGFGLLTHEAPQPAAIASSLCTARDMRSTLDLQRGAWNLTLSVSARPPSRSAT